MPHADRRAGRVTVFTTLLGIEVGARCALAQAVHRDHVSVVDDVCWAVIWH